MTQPMAIRIWAILLLSLAFGVRESRAGIINVFNDKDDFLNATGATSVSGAIPNEGNKGTGPNPLPDAVSVPRITFDSTSGNLFFGTAGQDQTDFIDGQWSSVIPGHDIAISGVENMDVILTLGAPAFSLGFDFHEPSIDNDEGIVTNTCNLPAAGNDCVDSLFRVTLLNGAAVVGTFDFNADDDVLTFIGVHTDMAFDTASIVEIRGTADNEYFGEFYAGTVPAPEPGTLALIGLGFLALVSRRRRLS